MPLFKQVTKDPYCVEMHVNCIYGDNDNAVHLAYDPSNNWEELIVSFHLVIHGNIFKRIWRAAKYACGYKSKYGNWDEVILSKEDAKGLAEFLYLYILDTDVI